MKDNYTRTILYAYANIDAVKEQIDDLVERRALSSMTDFSPCIEQCEKMLEYTAQKVALIELKGFVDRVLKKRSAYEMDCLEYKYFKRKPKEYFIGFDYESRSYFRKQVRLIKKLGEGFEGVGLTDSWFEKNCLNTTFFKELLRRVESYEAKCNKNKKSVKKSQPKQKIMLIA